jgi:hypothetical protein
MRLILLLMLLSTFIIIPTSDSGRDPNGGTSVTTAIHGDQGGGTDPDGASFDAGPRMDPDGSR